MKTIDEVIENLKYDYEIDMYIRDIAPQIVEWLEELKALKAENAELHSKMQAISVTVDMAEKEIRAKVIDEFVEKAWQLSGSEDVDIYAKELIDEIAEEYNNESVKGDLISRSSVIETIWNLFNRWGNDSVRFSEDETRLINTAFRMVQRDIEKLTTTHNDGWIPCGERLPEEKDYDDGYVEPSDDVLVFTKYGSYKVSRYWGNRRNQRDYYDWVDIKYRKDEVLAWQPLPAPYQPKGE